jgi:hypothetical protein
MKFTQIAQRIEQGFESSTGKTPEFKSFASQFKKTMKRALRENNAELISFSVGHFDLSGFYQVDGQMGYFSLPDVRMGMRGNMALMYRTADHEKDYTGGMNRWTALNDEAAQALASIA